MGKGRRKTSWTEGGKRKMRESKMMMMMRRRRRRRRRRKKEMKKKGRCLKLRMIAMFCAVFFWSY